MGLFQKIARRLYQFDLLAERNARLEQSMERVREALGRIEARQVETLCGAPLAAQEFRVFSQWGEDGIIQFLIRRVPIPRKIFVEFGVENYTESNTRFLLTNNQWKGLVIDGSAENIAFIQRDAISWRHTLKAVHSFVTRENINQLLYENGIEGEIGLLSVDIDGNDYWVWEAITAISPALVVVEYNSLFGAERAVTVPYDPAFQRGRAHYSHVYYGASLAALVALGRRKGYAFVGANSAGNNAFFVRRELRPAVLPELTAVEGFVARQFREARTKRGKLAFLSPEEEASELAKLPLIEIES
jgi:hypothetical protein